MYTYIVGLYNPLSLRLAGVEDCGINNRGVTVMGGGSSAVFEGGKTGAFIGVPICLTLGAISSPMPESLQSTIKHCSRICLLLVGQFEPKLNSLGLGEDGAGTLMVLGCLYI